MSIANNIKQLRKQKHLTQKQLAEKSGLAVITIQQYEAGKFNPKPDTVMKLCVGLDCKITDIIDDETQKYYRMFDNIKETNNTPKYTNSNSNNNIHKYDGSIRVKITPESIEFDRLIRKHKSNENFTEEERQWLINYFKSTDYKEAFERLGQSLETIISYLTELQTAYVQLNKTGQKEAIKRVKELTEIKKYTEIEDEFYE